MNAPFSASWYIERVRYYEEQGMTTSDAQGTADADELMGRYDAPQECEHEQSS